MQYPVTVSRAHSIAMSMQISYDTPAVDRDVCFVCPDARLIVC